MKTKEAKQSHKEEELPTSSDNSSAIHMKKNDLKKNSMTLTDRKQNQAKEDKAAMMKRKKKNTRVYNTLGAGCLDSLQKGKASDSNGTRTEDIKTCDDTAKEMIRQLFNGVMKQYDCTPKTWRIILLRVIYKQGDAEEAKIYRPICALLALYNLFSTLLFNRFNPRLDCVRWRTREGFDDRTKRWII